MNKHLQNYLFEKYPVLFRQKDLSKEETCMCWGIECGDGWFGLIDRSCERIQDFINKNPNEKCEVVQVKEKYGSLRMYLQGSNDFFFQVEQEALGQSLNVCEECGETSGVRPSTGGWVRVRCIKHDAEYLAMCDF